MNQHEFQTIMVYQNGKHYYFTGSFKRRSFPLLCKLFRMREIIPDLTLEQDKAEFHLSPKETEDAINTLRATYPEYHWHSHTVVLDNYTNEAMLPRFLIIVKRKGSNTWRYYRSGATGEKLKVTPTLTNAKFYNIDELHAKFTTIHNNHKDYWVKGIPIPNDSIHADDLDAYLQNNPPKSLYMTFHLPK